MTSDMEENAPLHWACRHGHLPVVKYLIADQRLDINRTDSALYTPLHYAAMNGHTAIVDLLLAQKATVDMVAEDGATPLHLAASQGHLSIVKSLVRAGAAIDFPRANSYQDTALHYAAGFGHAAMLKFLVASSPRHSLSRPNAIGMTPLHCAVMFGHNSAKFESVVTRAGNLIRANDPKWKFEGRYLPIVTFLVQSGADLMMRNKHGNTPIDIALSGPPSDITVFLAPFSILINALRDQHRQMIRMKNEIDRLNAAACPSLVADDDSAAVISVKVEAEMPDDIESEKRAFKRLRSTSISEETATIPLVAQHVVTRRRSASCTADNL